MANAMYAQNAYLDTMVTTSTTPLDLVILLYDGAIGRLNKAIFSLNEGKKGQKAQNIAKTTAIIEELLATLNLEAGGEIAANLQDIYLYMLKELTVANLKNDVEKMRHVEYLLRDLRDAWKQIKC